MQISNEYISRVIVSAIDRREFCVEEDTAIIFYDFDILNSRLTELSNSFPANSNHAVAIKANPTLSVLKHIVGKGFGLEAASLPEIRLAVEAGSNPKDIVFDSPSKTQSELVFALQLGCHINADSIPELHRIDELLKQFPNCEATFGLRINPQVGAGAIESTSVAAEYSKFAVPLRGNESDITEAYRTFDWLSGIHSHIGSQGCSLDMLLAGAKFIESLVKEMEGSGGVSKLQQVDVGGGLPAQYRASNNVVTMEEYATELQRHVPYIFTDERKIITEFGRHLHANAGWVVSKVEYVKTNTNPHTIMTHVGADMFIRECYRPKDWYHDILLYDPFGRFANEPGTSQYNVAGPLCFAGDIIGRDIFLPTASEGDLLVVKDSGAYTFAMWSRYNSRQMPKIVGYSEIDGQIEFRTIKERESVDDLVAFWK